MERVEANQPATRSMGEAEPSAEYQFEEDEISDIDTSGAEKYFVCSMRRDEDGTIWITPMNESNSIVIHGEREAEEFIGHLRDCIRAV